MLQTVMALLVLSLLPLAQGESLLQALSADRPDEEVFPLPSAPRHLPPFGTEVVGPKSTNKFWANWVVEEGRQLSIHPMPYVLRYDSADGTPNMKVSRSASPHIQYGDAETNGADKIRYYFSPFVNEFGLAAVEAASNDGQIIVKEGLFGVHAEVRGLPGTQRKILFPIYSGMSYVSGHYQGFTPRISSDRALLVVEAVGDGIWRLLNNGGKEFRLYAIDSSGNFVDNSFQFSLDGTMNKPFSGWIRLAEVQSPEDRAILDQHAPGILVDWQLDVERGGLVRYRFTKHAGVSTQLLHFAYASHEKLMTGTAQEMSLLTAMAAPTKGRMKGVVGDMWELQADQSEAESISFLPVNEPHSSKVADLKEKAYGTLQFFQHSDQWKLAMFRGSYYFSGKGFQKVAYTCLLLEKFYGVAHSHTQSCADILRRGFQCLYAPTAPECNGAPIGLYYDVAWNGVASREGFSDTGCRTADFGNACYNDHHYHFSYFVVSAAVLVKLKPEFSTNQAFVSFVDTLIRDTANPSLQDAHFPMFRSFDWFDLHSWSRGVIPSADGKDQESTSEELNLLYGIRLWGMVLHRESLQALGTTMLALCASTIREFFLMTKDNEHHPEDFVTNHVTGIFFQNKVDYATWFGWRYEFIHGIQMLPVTPALLMIRTPEFCRQEWNNILSRLPLSPTDPWTSLLLTGTLAIIDPEGAYSRLSAMLPEYMDDGLTWVWSLYWSASLSGQEAATTTVASSSSTVSVIREENLALNRLAVASSELSPEDAAARAVDGLFVTRWSPSLQDESPWLYVDLGAVHALSHIVVFWGEFYPSSYLLQGKVTQWTTLAVAAGTSDLLRTDLPRPTFAQFVRVMCQSGGTDIRLWELQVFADVEVTTSTSVPTTAVVTSTEAPSSTTSPNLASTTETTTGSSTAPATTATTSSGSTTTPFYGPNLAFSKPVLASSFRSPTEHAYKAVDGELDSQWASAPLANQWLWVDLLGVYSISQVVIVWGEEYGDYVLQTAPDGIKWTDVATAIGAPGAVSTVFEPAILAQWVRVLCQSACSIRELHIQGGVPGAAATTTMATTSMAPTPQTTARPSSTSVGAATSSQGMQKANLALRRPVLSSSQRLPDEHVSRMVDGSEHSQWASASSDATPWAWVDLLGVQNVGEVAIHWGDDYADVYDLQTSANAVDWITVATESGHGGQTVRSPLSAQTQWIRVLCRSMSGSSCSIKELAVYEGDSVPATSAPTAENLAKDKPVLASSQVLPYEHASRAVDGLTSTQWASAPGEQWIWVDLLQSYELDHVLISWGSTQPSSYDLQTSSNAVNWDLAVADVQPGASVRTEFPAGTRSQWLRVFCKGSSGCSIQEMQVFGSPSRRLSSFESMVRWPYVTSCALLAFLLVGFAVARIRPSSVKYTSDVAELEACMP